VTGKGNTTADHAAAGRDAAPAHLQPLLAVLRGWK